MTHRLTAKAIRFVDRAAAILESKCRRGRVRVMSLLCTDCGRWVKARDWNPDTAVCEGCTAHVRMAAATGRYGNSEFHPMTAAARS